jgi:hypothetical protein
MGEAIMAKKSLRKLLLSLTVATVLSCSWAGNVFADGDERVEALEARIAELESLVHQLLDQEREAPPAATQEPAVTVELVEVKAQQFAEASVAAALEEHQAAVAESTHKHSYKFGGYIKADFIYSDFNDGPYSGAGRDFYIPATVKIGGEGESYLDFHAKETRIFFKSTHNLDNGSKVGTYLEMDFQLSPGGDERISNSYNPRMRHAFVTYNKWLFGQTWMTFYNVGTNPENLDFVGPADGSLFGRQVQIRYTTGNWMFSVENPETTVTPFGGGGRIVADDNHIPDAVVRYNLKGDWGSFSAAGMVRQLSYENNAAGIDDDTTGWGVSVAGKFLIGERDDFRWMASVGDGLGRYIGLNTTNAVVLDAENNLRSIGVWGAYGSYRHFWSEKWRSNLTLSYLAVDNDTNRTGFGVTKNVGSIRGNLIYSPVPKILFGIELMFANREIETGADGDLTRVQFSAKYAY